MSSSSHLTVTPVTERLVDDILRVARETADEVRGRGAPTPPAAFGDVLAALDSGALSPGDHEPEQLGFEPTPGTGRPGAPSRLPGSRATLAFHRPGNVLQVDAHQPGDESLVFAPGDRVVITAGTLVNVPGTTNVIKVEVA